MSYVENPKTKGSGVICAIPQTGECPVKCADCFFQSGRSYLEPLCDNLPNMPSVEEARGRIVRVNDGNDSNNKRSVVLAETQQYVDKFYNTSIPRDLEGFNAPVVLTANPGDMTDRDAHFVHLVPNNLMFVRIRANTWNVELAKVIAAYYTAHERSVPVVLTFMAYYNESLPTGHAQYYSFRKRTLNSYWVITQEAWNNVVSSVCIAPNVEVKRVYTCGKDSVTFGCNYCGNCLREYYATKERMRRTDSAK